MNYLVSSIGGDGEFILPNRVIHVDLEGEPLDEVVALCMAEHLQKQLISNHSSPVVRKIMFYFMNASFSGSKDRENHD